MTPALQSREARRICELAPVVPVLVVRDLARAEGLARALVAGGLPALEVTLRTPAALEAIRVMAAVEGGVVGAGTLLTPADVRAAKAAGARFGVSPGATPALVQACIDEGLPLLPGAATASEAMALLEQGYDMLKLFPAEAVGGRNLLKSLGGPLPQISFCPTGGITEATAPDYLALKNVVCVGGSWIAPDSDVDAANWSAITERAAKAAALRRS